MSVPSDISGELLRLLKEKGEDDFSEGESNYYVAINWDGDSREVFVRANRTGFKTVMLSLATEAFSETLGSHWHWDATKAFVCEVELIIGKRWTDVKDVFQILPVRVSQAVEPRCGWRYRKVIELVDTVLGAPSPQYRDVVLVEYPEYNQVGLEADADALLLVTKNIARLCLASVPGDGFSICSADPGIKAVKMTFEYASPPWEDPDWPGWDAVGQEA